MITTRFEWGEDVEYGFNGWLPVGMRNANAADGRVIAHDTLEHFPNVPNDMAGELMALGAMIRVRHEGGYFYQKTPMRPEVEYHLGADISNMLRAGYTLRTPPRTYRLKDGLEDVVQDSLREARKDIRYEETHGGQDFWIKPDALEEKLNHCAGWLRLGYQKALKRYQGVHPEELTWLFIQIEDDVKEHFKQGDLGEKLIVSVNLKQLTHSIRREYDYEEEY